MPPPDGIVYRSLSPAPLIEFGLAYRSDDPSPIVANMVQLTRERAGHDSSADPKNGELVYLCLRFAGAGGRERQPLVRGARSRAPGPPSWRRAQAMTGGRFVRGPA